MKFGGTSVRDEVVRGAAVARVEEAVRSGAAVVVVVSAMGRSGDPYATDTLLGLLPPGGTVKPDEMDLLLSVGEIISAVVFAAELRRRHLAAQALTGGQAGILTDDRHGEARILDVRTDRLEGLLDGGVIPVVAGFQGVSADGLVTTLGRGASDTTAAALGAALAARQVDIYTDVSGVMTADPRLVPEAGILAAADYEEVFQLAEAGAKVIHPRAVEIARQAGVPLRVLGVDGEGEGTLIAGRRELNDTWASRSPNESVVGVSARSDVSQITVKTPADRGQSQRRVFAALAEASISVDLINVFPEFSAFIVPDALAERAKETVASMGLEVSVRGDVAKVSIVGTAIHGLPGVMSHVVNALADAGVGILQSSDSHQSISCLVDRSLVARAASALHTAFGLGREGTVER